jgi:outer membrane protein TolC
MLKIRYKAILILIFTASSLAALDLDTTLALASGAGDAKLAALQAEYAAAQYEAARYTGDLSLSLDGNYRRTSDELFAPPKSDSLALSAALGIPLGLSSEAAEKAAAAEAQARYSMELLPWSQALTRLKAYTLYAAAWSAQENAALSERERDLAEREFESAQARFKAGTLAYADYRKAEENIIAARDAALSADMSRRITRLELFGWLGIGDDGQSFSYLAPALGTLPKAPELAAHALINDPALRDAALRLQLSQEQIERALGFELPFNLKLSLAKDGHSAAVSYDSDKPVLSLSYELPAAQFSGNAAESPWTLSATLGIRLDTGGADKRLAESLALAAEADRIRLEAAMDKLSLDLRLAYQAWQRADAQREQAIRNAALAGEVQAAVAARAAQGTVMALDLDRATIDAQRAALNAQVKAFDAERARMNAALIARYLLTSTEENK